MISRSFTAAIENFTRADSYSEILTLKSFEAALLQLKSKYAVTKRADNLLQRSVSVVLFVKVIIFEFFFFFVPFKHFTLKLLHKSSLALQENLGVPPFRNLGFP